MRKKRNLFGELMDGFDALVISVLANERFGRCETEARAGDPR